LAPPPLPPPRPTGPKPTLEETGAADAAASVPASVPPETTQQPSDTNQATDEKQPLNPSQVLEQENAFKNIIKLGLIVKECEELIRKYNRNVLVSVDKSVNNCNKITIYLELYAKIIALREQFKAKLHFSLDNPLNYPPNIIALMNIDKPNLQRANEEEKQVQLDISQKIKYELGNYLLPFPINPITQNFYMGDSKLRLNNSSLLQTTQPEENKGPAVNRTTKPKESPAELPAPQLPTTPKPAQAPLRPTGPKPASAQAPAPEPELSQQFKDSPLKTAVDKSNNDPIKPIRGNVFTAVTAIESETKNTMQYDEKTKLSIIFGLTEQEVKQLKDKPIDIGHARLKILNDIFQSITPEDFKYLIEKTKLKDDSPSYLKSLINPNRNYEELYNKIEELIRTKKEDAYTTLTTSSNS
jgi:hypothetical protein